MTIKRKQNPFRERSIGGLDPKQYSINSTERYIRSNLERKKRGINPLEAFILSNLKLVGLYANKFANYRANADDLVSVGVEALINLFPKFDSSKSQVRGPYVQCWLRHYMGNYVRKHISSFSMPVNQRETEEYKRACDPTSVVSIDSIENSESYYYTIPEENVTVDCVTKEKLRKAMTTLTPDEHKAVELFYFHDLMYPEVDKILGKKNACMHRLANARQKIKRYFNNHKINMEF